jgi:hypothetical protein
MDSNSTLLPNPQSSSRKREGCRVKGDHFLWLRITTNIRNRRIALHTRFSRAHGCELIHALQHFRSTKKNSVPYLPVCRNGIYFRTAYSYRVRSQDLEIPGQQLDR